MFIFRRLSENDVDFKFTTSNKDFDEKDSDGRLAAYLNEDIVRGGDYYTYILFEEKDNENSLILGLLRYKYNFNDYYLGKKE